MKTSTILAKAKPLVGRTFKESYVAGHERFICCALMVLQERGRIAEHDYHRVCRIIESRLFPHTTLETWLEDKGVRALRAHNPRPIEILDRVQQHRHAWLDLMIKEFKRKGD